MPTRTMARAFDVRVREGRLRAGHTFGRKASVRYRRSLVEIATAIAEISLQSRAPALRSSSPSALITQGEGAWLRSLRGFGEQACLIEANLEEGVVAVPLSKYAAFNTRICRPVGLTSADRRKVIEFMISHLGCGYDTRHVIDLARYLLPTPPVPVRWRRRMIAFGSGDPTRTICSTLIAGAFECVRYPVLPRIERTPDHAQAPDDYRRCEILHIRDHRLFVPCDFDVSPYFRIVKPTIENDFDYQQLRWASCEAAIPRGISGPRVNHRERAHVAVAYSN
jgi:hypothetical protein